MADWRMARSLDQLLAQVNQLAPSRSKVSDGGKGDPAHAARVSDHNPARFSWADCPLVLARDFTDDVSGGLDCQKLYLALMHDQDQRIRYVIWRRQITSGSGGPHPWAPRPYSGLNAHTKHLHISVVHDARADVGIPWLLRMNVPVLAPGVKPTPNKRFPELRYGQRSDAVKRLQAFLAATFPSYADIEADGIYGDATKRAVREFQRRAKVHGSPLDGSVVGPATSFALAEYGYKG